MFTLKIHTVDTPQPLSLSDAAASTYSLSPNFNAIELRAAVHLFRYLPAAGASTSHPAATSLSNPSSRTTALFVAAVPNYLPPEEFLLFCGSQVTHFSQLLFLRNDGMEDRYSVLIWLENQVTADGFYCNFNGKRFKPSEAEVCHIYFAQAVENTELAEVACTPPPGYTELPTCPVCLERLDQDTSAIQATFCDHSFHCSCVSKWTYLSCQVCRLCQQQDEKPICAVCRTPKNPWVCLICGFVGCGRYEEGHAKKHWSDTQHCYSLELETQQIWDYVGDKYVHRLNQSKLDGKTAMTNYRCTSLDEECGTCGYNEDSGIGGALIGSKVEAIVDEYNDLLATQMETQRQHYEFLLLEAKSRKESSIAEARETAEASLRKMHDIQHKMEEVAKEKKAVEDIQEQLVEVTQFYFRGVSLLKSRDEKILDLEEQIRDLTVYIEAQRTLANMTDADIKGGTVLPVQSNQLSSGNPKRRTKSGRKRN
ncbi:hypothetical protein RJ640_006098 [Escallonia rubra]|uniref:BRCA1-associated protein n=1 Tax=Escallonia rubra TaxID=112253 RepID=A0AA88URR7_9ASTE|nr:hypothetical protein RJ640_006098 [Escallonia rubra]